MKNLLQLNGVNVEFYEPYFIYDIVNIYDKTAKEYVIRRRASAISYSNHGEIIIATAICSDEDSFSKKQARNILMNRLLNMVQYVIGPSFDKAYMHADDECYYFAAVSCYDEYCTLFDRHSRLFFTPYKINYLDRVPQSSFVDNKGVTRTRVTSVVKSMDTLKKGVSDVYLHRDFINSSYYKFMNVLENGKPVYTNDSHCSTSPCSNDCDVD